tara:strand:- start:736 stop:1320 length:585 start_codon:yes stop_codon:yes gene_type:complete
MTWYTQDSGSSTERMRISDNGIIALGSTHMLNCRLVVNPRVAGTDSEGIRLYSRADVFDVVHIRFQHSSGYSTMGTISSSNTGAVSYNTTSDYRLKKNDINITDGITRVKQLRPIKFNWIAEPNITEEGFLAHEAQEVVPQSVTGAKDEMNKDGTIKEQVMDSAKLIPLLTASIKELIAEVETLKAKVAALEGS